MNTVLYHADTADGREFFVAGMSGAIALGNLNPGGDSHVNNRDAAGQIGDEIVFAARSPDGGAEPWLTDGTPAGTRQLADIVPGPDGSDPTAFVASAG